MTDERAEVLLELRDVHTYYGQVHALKGISLDVRRGEIVTLIGANGAGKSTTLRTISGLVKARSGSVQFRGRPIHQMAPYKIAALGIVHIPEGRRIFADMSVEENLELGAYLNLDPQRRKQHMDRVFELFPRLAERRRQRGGTLSGGEQQMLAIGRALMQNPEVLLLDEPTLGLAPVLVEQLFEKITELNRCGVTMLLVEQNAWLALKVAHRGYVVQTGEITLHGPASELAANPVVQSAYLGD